jgi:predicted NUDIX family NTP pyrophosphohydrolase
LKTVSCGILVCNPQSELLLCHATGTARWDIPKGQGEPGETTLQTALRETGEETGLAFQGDDLIDLGRFAYRPSKDLWLYAALTERFDAGRCRCSTGYLDRAGRMRLEMDGFAWTRFVEVPQRCAPNMARLLGSTLLLPDILKRLQDAGRVARPLQ